LRAQARLLIFPLWLAAAAAPALAADAETPSLGARYDALGTPNVAGTIAAPAELKVGHATITPSSGARLLVLEANGRRCGWVLDGTAQLVYRVEDRFSVPIARRNLRKAGLSPSDDGAALRFTRRVSGVAVWSWNAELGDAELAPAAGTKLPAWLRDHLEHKLGGNPERDLLLSDLNGEPGYEWALFHGGGEDLVLDVDPRPQALEEALAEAKKLSQVYGPWAGKLAHDVLATQPLGRSWLEPRRYDFASVETDITLRNAAKDDLAVDSKTRIAVLRDGLRVLSFQLTDEVWLKRATRRENKVERVAIDGQSAPYHLDEGTLLVELPREFRRGEALELEVSTAGDVLDRPAGDSYWMLGPGFYPVPTLSGIETAELRVTAEVAAPFVPFVGGEILERSSAGGVNRVRTRLAAPSELLFVLAGNYSTIALDGAEPRVHVSAYAGLRPQQAKKVGDVVLAARGCYERWFGTPYPFQDLQVVEINDWGWGMAPAGIIFVTKEAFITQARAESGSDNLEWIGEIASRGINERLAHEVAHAWFPHVVKVRRSEESWLSESLADYTSAYCMEQVMGRQGHRHFERQLKDWKDSSKRAGEGTSVYFANNVFGEDRGVVRQDLLYGRGPLVLHTVRQQLEKSHGKEEGEKLFLTWIRSYVKNFANREGETRNLVAILEQITGEKWMPFFERHLIGTEPPPVR
jgi:hypothetical protein